VTAECPEENRNPKRLPCSDGSYRRVVVHSGAKSDPDTLYRGRDGDILRATDGEDRIWAGAGPDLLVAGSGEDQLHGWTGNDLLMATGEDGLGDYVEGGPGFDTCHIRAEDRAVRCEDVIVH
jgi:Ca2+-binding RTX toxin-like protein